MKKIYLLFTAILALSCSTELESEKSKELDTNLSNKKIKITQISEGKTLKKPVGNNINQRQNNIQPFCMEPNHYYITQPIPTISESEYSVLTTLGTYYAGTALQNTFIDSYASFINLTDDDIFVTYLEGVPPGFNSATSGVSPSVVEYCDYSSNWQWIENPNSTTDISQRNVTDLYLSASIELMDQIQNDPNITDVNKLKIEIDYSFGGNMYFKFTAWFN